MKHYVVHFLKDDVSIACRHFMASCEAEARVKADSLADIAYKKGLRCKEYVLYEEVEICKARY